MTIAAEIQSLSPSSLIELFVLDFSNIAGGTVAYFHAGTNGLRQSVVWQGNSYAALPIEASGFDISTRGALPRPIIQVANINGLFSGLVQSYDGLIGAKITRKRTFARFLDAVNFPNGNPFADPSQYLPDDLWFIERKTTENKYIIEWELSCPFDVQGVTLPARQIIQNSCPWKYRGTECGYTGPGFDINNNPTSDPTLDTCTKTLAGCNVRHVSSGGVVTIVPFGGFPGASRA